METVVGLARVAALLALIAGALLAIGFGANWLYFRYRRRNAERCAALAAAQLGLVSRAGGDPSVPLWQGGPVGQTVIVAAHTWASLDAAGARFPFFATPMVAIAAPFDPPLPPAFVLTTGRDKKQSVRTGDIAFDLEFAVDSQDESSMLAILGNDDVRRGISRLLGERNFWSGSGRAVEITQYGVLVRETVPGSRKTSALAADVLAAALALRNRASFLPPKDRAAD